MDKKSIKMAQKSNFYFNTRFITLSFFHKRLLTFACGSCSKKHSLKTKIANRKTGKLVAF